MPIPPNKDSDFYQRVKSKFHFVERNQSIVDLLCIYLIKSRIKLFLYITFPVDHPYSLCIFLF